MQHSQRWKQAGLVALTCLLGQVVLAQPSDTPQPLVEPMAPTAATGVATVQNVIGQLEVQRPGAPAAADLLQKASLFNGDVTSTGASSKATLLFNEGSQVQINAGSIIELTSSERVSGNRRSIFRLVKGEALVRARSPLAVLTPGGTAAVRGTLFHLRVDDDGTTTLTVLEGVVEFFNAFGSVIVRERGESIGNSGQAPTQPIPVPGAQALTWWAVELDRAPVGQPQGTPPANGVIGKIVPVAARKKGFFRTNLPALAIAVVVGVLVSRDDDDPPGFITSP